ncbi:MAG: hypothetical protein F6K31_38520 [Symploca sp. SIO2G7]|nr:hypothetical protein [Symploca sp. SIO2G7]
MIQNLAFWLENIDTPRAQALRPYQNEYYPNVAGIDITSDRTPVTLEKVRSWAVSK